MLWEMDDKIICESGWIKHAEIIYKKAFCAS